MLASAINRKTIRSTELKCPKGCSAPNSSRDGSIMCSSCGLVLKADEFEAEFFCGGFDKTRTDYKPQVESRIQREIQQQKSRQIRGDISSENEIIKHRGQGQAPCKEENLKEEWWRSTTSQENRQREVNKYIGEFCTRYELNHSEKEEISALAESILSVFDSRRKRCRSLKSLVAACFYECSKRLHRSIAINDLCNHFLVKQRKLLKYCKKLSKYHHSLPVSHSQRVRNEWDYLTDSLFKKLPNFVSLLQQRDNSYISNNSKMQLEVNPILSQQGASSGQKIFTREGGNLFGKMEQLNCLLNSEKISNGKNSVLIGNSSSSGTSSLPSSGVNLPNQLIDSTYIPELNSSKGIVFRQQVKEVQTHEISSRLQAIRIQLKSLYECEYLSIMRMGKHPLNFICTLLYFLLKANMLEFKNNRFCSELGIKYSTLSREKKQLSKLLIDSMKFSLTEIPSEIQQDINQIILSSSKNIKTKNSAPSKNISNNNNNNSTNNSSTQFLNNDFSNHLNASHWANNSIDLRLNARLIEYALKHVLLIDADTPFLESQESNDSTQTNLIYIKEEQNVFSYNSSPIIEHISLCDPTASHSNSSSHSLIESTSPFPAEKELHLCSPQNLQIKTEVKVEFLICQ